ncbi:hypothetical protein GCM10023349_01790 [Nocardioides conyzicola]|uniref:SHOCT domain-containing protein n=2 Tax=Nocardioides conyzicola TaxID=1651781 RepID=A0ABP8WM35_9ACTN
MRRVPGLRHDHLGVLRTRPPLDPMVDSPADPPAQRTADVVRRLLRLVDAGLLSEEEFEVQVLRSCRASAAGPAPWRS